jgi:tRNA modification GTPase
VGGASGVTHRSTIVGVATGTPDGGVAIVRLSGPDADAIAVAIGARVDTPRLLQRRRLQIGESEEDALVVRMPAPASYTGEDVVELHVHGGARNVEQIVAALVDAGAVAAARGEFTRRAFDAGRLTLDQAEGIAALVGAQTQTALDQARRLMRGEVGRAAAALSDRLVDLRAEIEARLDFPDDVDDVDRDRIVAHVEEVATELRRWVSRYAAGARARARPRIVLAGPPNAGKSSLLNALVEQPRAIVTPVPGTTRDVLEVETMLGGVEALVIDTAGLREVEEIVERIGVERAREQLACADLVLWLEPADGEAAERPVIANEVDVMEVETKRDLGVRRADRFGLSITDEASVARLRDELARRVMRDASDAWIGTLRHKELAADAVAELERATKLRESPELMAFHLMAAAGRLAEIEGRDVSGPIGQDVLHRVFERFCIGK